MPGRLSNAKEKLKEQIKRDSSEQKRKKYADDQEAARFRRAKEEAAQEARRQAREDFLEDAQEEEKEFIKRRERRRLKRRRAKTKSVGRRLAEVKHAVVDQLEDDTASSNASSGQDNSDSGAVGVDLSPLESELEENTDQLAAVDDTLGELESEIEGLTSAVGEGEAGGGDSSTDQDPLAAMGFDTDDDPWSADTDDDPWSADTDDDPWSADTDDDPFGGMEDPWSDDDEESEKDQLEKMGFSEENWL